MREFGIYRRLRDIREDMDLTQVDIANYLGVDKSTYSRWETETEIMPLKHVGKFANFTKKSLDYIAGLSADSSSVNHTIDVNKKEIGIRLKSIRVKLGYTQDVFANILGCNQSCISAYESGKRLIPSSYVFEVCRLYNISFDWLVGGIKKY